MNIGLMGFGTVGMGVYEILNIHSQKHNEIKKYRVAKILVRTLNKKRDIKVPDNMLTDNADDILNDPSIDVVVCVMGGVEPEYSYIKRALQSGKHVVTANKQIVSEHIDELLTLAKMNDVNFMFEASVGGGIPVISTLAEIIRFNNITRIQGILNGTTNYILTKIAKEKREFDEILKEAQRIGFAEADPSADVDGYDIMRKILILSSIAFKHVITQDEVHLRGVGNITLDDITAAAEYGYNIKYLAQGILHDDTYSISVTPVLMKNDLVMSNVNEEYNVVLIEGDIIGELCLSGKGAGKNATANAVVSDVIKAASNDGTYNNLKFNANVSSSGITGIANKYFVRVCIDCYETLSEVSDIIDKIITSNHMHLKSGKLFIMTENISSQSMKSLYEKLSEVCGDVFYARIENNLL